MVSGKWLLVLVVEVFGEEKSCVKLALQWDKTAVHNFSKFGNTICLPV